MKKQFVYFYFMKTEPEKTQKNVPAMSNTGKTKIQKNIQEGHSQTGQEA